jgi:sigma-B regulation protein RsbU (phosphoserine phosphatase)
MSPLTPPATPRPRPEARAPFGLQLQNFWNRVTEGLELNQLWSQFKSDAKSSYRLYSRDFPSDSMRRDWRHNFFHTFQEFAWAILEKLSPARRVLLLLGIILLIIPGGGFSYHGKTGEVQVLEFDFHFYAGLLFLLILLLEIADRVVMKRDLQIARDIQGWLLPATAPNVPGVSIAFATRPANTVAGDYYDVFGRPGHAPGETKYILAVADVAGKSIPAALLMATFQASLKTLSATHSSLPELVINMNRYACSNSQSGLRFTTAVVAEYDPLSRRLTYINAGHNAPILRRASGAIERLTCGGIPFGIQSECPYESGSVVMEPGDWLVIFTDGLVEAVNDYDQEYDEPRLLSVLEASAMVTPDQLLRRVMTDVDAFVGTTPQHDDITCLMLKVE